jgi:hypothetical protein
MYSEILMDWKEYEVFVFEAIKSAFPNAEYEYNSKRLGRYSKGLRQCDVIIKEHIQQEEHITLVDAKYYDGKLDVKDVEMFISMSKDVGASRGIIVSPFGYSELAYNRAENDESDILLEILNLEDLKQFQGYGAIPYAGENGVLLSSPLGWIIDAKGGEGFVASSYRKGLNFALATEEHEFMYFNFWKKDNECQSPADLIESQNWEIMEHYLSASMNMTNGKFRSVNYTLRKMIIDSYPSPEYTCVVDHGEFLFFGVLFSPENREKVNTRKLIEIVTRSIPINIKMPNHR